MFCRIIAMISCLLLTGQAGIAAKDELQYGITVETIDMAFFRGESGTFVLASELADECSLNQDDPATDAFVRVTFSALDDEYLQGPIEVDVFTEDEPHVRYTISRFSSGKVSSFRFFENGKRHMLFGPFEPTWPYQIFVRHNGTTETLISERYCQG